MVTQRRIPRNLRLRRKSPHLASKRSNHHNHVTPQTPSLTKSYSAFNVVALAWHPTSNALSFTTSQGQLYRWKNCIPSSYPPSHGPMKRAPTNPLHHADSETSLSRSPSILSRQGGYMDDDDDDFVIDDDGAGYVPAGARKRSAPWDERDSIKRRATDFRVRFHPPFQSGSTPWRGNRRYLSMCH